MINELPTAFPWMHKDVTCTGMTLRDYFAAKAMQTMISYRRNHFEKHNEDMSDWDEFFSVIAEESYSLADVMIKARGQA